MNPNIKPAKLEISFDEQKLFVTNSGSVEPPPAELPDMFESIAYEPVNNAFQIRFSRPVDVVGSDQHRNALVIDPKIVRDGEKTYELRRISPQ